MTPPAFTAAALLIMSSTIGLATHSTTQSGLSGISESAGTQGRPSRFWYFGLIAYTLPVKADRLDRVRSPNDPRVSDAPTMATTLGSIKRRRSSWRYSARAVVEAMFNPYRLAAPSELNREIDRARSFVPFENYCARYRTGSRFTPPRKEVSVQAGSPASSIRSTRLRNSRKKETISALARCLPMHA